MKKTLILSLLVAASTSITALADTIRIPGGYGPYQVGNGGEITVIPSFGVSGYVPGLTSGLVGSGSFQTFCVELHEPMVDGTYSTIPADVTQMSGITLNKGTAWLYEQFAAGTLKDYFTAPDRKAAAAALQQEIWFLMGTQVPTGSSFDSIVNDAALAGGWKVSDANTPEFSDVKILNVWKIGLVGDRTGAIQDVLYIPGTSVPDGGLTLALLGMGLTGLGVISRRIRK